MVLLVLMCASSLARLMMWKHRVRSCAYAVNDVCVCTADLSKNGLYANRAGMGVVVCERCGCCDDDCVCVYVNYARAFFSTQQINN